MQLVAMTCKNTTRLGCNFLSLNSYSLMSKCWIEDSRDRPGFSLLHEEINELIKPLAGYFELTNVV